MQWTSRRPSLHPARSKAGLRSAALESDRGAQPSQGPEGQDKVAPSLVHWRPGRQSSSWHFLKMRNLKERHSCGTLLSGHLRTHSQKGKKNHTVLFLALFAIPFKSKSPFCVFLKSTGKQAAVSMPLGPACECLCKGALGMQKVWGPRSALF